jgi:hypothetical protein
MKNLKPDKNSKPTETQAILADPRIMKAIHDGERDIQDGQTISWEEIRRRHGMCLRK